MSTNVKVSPYVFPGIKNQDEVRKIRKFKRDRVKIEDVLKIIAENCGVKSHEIVSRIRKRTLIDARFIFCYMLKSEFNFTYESIGKILDRDHTTIIHSVKTHKERYQTYNDYKEITDGIQKDIKYYIP
jgi:chromosomal replication initiation ATPase DnaA